MFAKTKMCKFFMAGMCNRGTDCLFAHTNQEKNPLPDLTCTKMCKALLHNRKCTDPECKYAHSKRQIRPVLVPPRKTSAEPESEPQCDENWQNWSGGANWPLQDWTGNQHWFPTGQWPPQDWLGGPRQPEAWLPNNDFISQADQAMVQYEESDGGQEDMRSSPSPEPQQQRGKRQRGRRVQQRMDRDSDEAEQSGAEDLRSPLAGSSVAGSAASKALAAVAAATAQSPLSDQPESTESRGQRLLQLLRESISSSAETAEAGSQPEAPSLTTATDAEESPAEDLDASPKEHGASSTRTTEAQSSEDDEDASLSKAEDWLQSGLRALIADRTAQLRHDAPPARQQMLEKFLDPDQEQWWTAVTMDDSDDEDADSEGEGSGCGKKKKEFVSFAEFFDFRKRDPLKVQHELYWGMFEQLRKERGLCE